MHKTFGDIFKDIYINKKKPSLTMFWSVEEGPLIPQKLMRRRKEKMNVKSCRVGISEKLNFGL